MYLQDNEIMNLYAELSNYYEKYLEEFGVILPKLKFKGQYTKNALILIYLYANFRKRVSKTELTDFLSKYGLESNDVQQARHLGQQAGWYIISGQRPDIECEEYGVRLGEYSLISYTKHYPNFTNLKRKSELGEDEWEILKKRYNYRCATCGSKEGESNLHYPNKITQLQKGHMDPSKPLSFDNVIPQCESCNRQDKNNFVYNVKGRVIKIHNPQFILRSNKEIKKHMLEILKNDLE